MKALQINTVCGTGSTGRIASDIHKMLIEQGHESVVAYGRGTAYNCDNTIKIGNNLDFYIHALKTRILDEHGFGSKNATRKFIERVKNYNPDIIHLHNVHGYYINIDLLFNFLKEYNKPIIWTLHSCWAFTGHCSHFDYANCYKWETHCQKCPQKTSFPKSIFIDNSYNNFEKKKKLFTGLDKLTLVTPSEWLAKLVKRSFLKDYTVKVINNGIDLSVFKPSPSNFRKRYNLENKFIILGVANKWEKRKGFEYFIELSKLIEPDETIVMVGLSKSALKQLPKNIIGITRTNNVQELAEIYTSADVFFNPTLEDNFPTTNLEALACGTPVITFNTGGSIETIDDTTGFIVEKGDLEQAIKTIRKIKTEGKEKYSESCIKRANKYYNKNNKFQEYIELYEERMNEFNVSNQI
ncbi:glycosyl transferase [Petrotoga sp. 8T1HF07.NaAc.6.1]|uniref:glycosyltransferase n=1 Tax=Petrotoga sp. 8T1HF07.NaAc.6.1 TaxID=1351838 RepID=UPI00192BB4C5|nr:glycosyltransferase [Petrotoga sp. 8T1HF07.NaAc.6.1]MBL5982266.1 glycosyl transferase [Petrotoga sp. 8T1HF07.NaAc.6.1]